MKKNDQLTSLLKTTKKNIDSEPIFFRLSNSLDRLRLETLSKKGMVYSVVDPYEAQLMEYFETLYPADILSVGFGQRFLEYKADLAKEVQPAHQGVWVFFPWNGCLVHILDHDAFFAVRTNRNIGLMTKAEQVRFYQATVGVAGLSVGSNIVSTLVMQGGARRIKIVDKDILNLSNLNRVQAPLEFIGLPKTVMMARKIYSINPFAEVEVFPDGLTTKNTSRFFEGLDVVVDEIDTISVKYLIREHARKLRVPLVSAADEGDSGIVHIERYDRDLKTAFFLGRLKGVTYEKTRGYSRDEIGKAIVRILNPANIPPYMQSAVTMVGKELVSWPQLGSTALVNGALIAYCIRRIANKQPIRKGELVFSLDSIFVPGYDTTNARHRRSAATRKFITEYL